MKYLKLGAIAAILFLVMVGFSRPQSAKAAHGPYLFYPQCGVGMACWQWWYWGTGSLLIEAIAAPSYPYTDWRYQWLGGYCGYYSCYNTVSTDVSPGHYWYYYYDWYDNFASLLENWCEPYGDVPQLAPQMDGALPWQGEQALLEDANHPVPATVSPDAAKVEIKKGAIHSVASKADIPTDRNVGKHELGLP